MFGRFAAPSASARAQGAIVLFVSHRLSTTTRADVIVMMRDGEVLDVGSHHDLLERCAPYAELYEIQAARYRS